MKRMTWVAAAVWLLGLGAGLLIYHLDKKAAPPPQVVVECVGSTPPAVTPAPDPAASGSVEAEVLRAKLGLGVRTIARELHGITNAMEELPDVWLTEAEGRELEAFKQALSALAAKVAGVEGPAPDADLPGLLRKVEALQAAWARLRPGLDRAVRAAKAAEERRAQGGEEDAAEMTPNWGPPPK